MMEARRRSPAGAWRTAISAAYGTIAITAGRIFMHANEVTGTSPFSSIGQTPE